jgi:hypothetical protein
VAPETPPLASSEVALKPSLELLKALQVLQIQWMSSSLRDLTPEHPTLSGAPLFIDEFAVHLTR